MLHWAVTLAAALQPCGRKATFEITEDGGTNFAGIVHIARLQVTQPLCYVPLAHLQPCHRRLNG